MSSNHLRALIIVCATALAIAWDDGTPLWLILLAFL